MIISNISKKLNMVSKRNLAIFERVSVVIMALILVLIYASKFYTAISFPYIQEYREPTMVVYASEFAKGHNPYAISALNESVPVVISVYGFLPALLCAPFVAFFGLFNISALVVCRVLTLIVELLALFFIAKSTYVLTGSKITSYFSAILATGLAWRYNPFGGAFTDIWGFCLLAIMTYLVIADDKKRKYHPVIYALILVISFYIKQYYIYAVIGLLIFLFINSKKDLIKLIISGIVMTIASLIIVQLIFPLFLSESLVISQTEPFAYGEYWGLPWSIGQIPFAIKHYYLVPSLVFIVAFIYLLYKKLINKEVFKSYLFLQLAGSFPLVLYTARNHGTYLTYWFQLWFIYLVIVYAVVIYSAVNSVVNSSVNSAVNSSDNSSDNSAVNSSNNYACRIISTCLILITSILFVYQARSIVIQVPHSEEEIMLWKKTYNYLSEYGSDGKILGDSCVALYLYDNGIETSEYGQAEYNGSTSIENIKKSSIYSMFPYAIKLNEINIEYEKRVKENLANKEYSVVELGNIYRYFITDEEMEEFGYTCIDRYDVFIGGLYIDTSIWIPAN